MHGQEIIWFVFVITERELTAADWSEKLLDDDVDTSTRSLRGTVGVNIDVDGITIATAILISSPAIDNLDALKDNLDVLPVG